MTLLAGVDAGASHTEAVMGNQLGEEIGRARGAPGNVRPTAVASAADAIAATVRAAADKAAHRLPVSTLVVGAAGTGLELERQTLHAALLEHGLADAVLVTSDGAVALESAFPDQPGILLNAGTGSIAHARDPAGDTWRVGGFGSRFGDEGSAYNLGRAAIRAALQGQEGRGPASTLVRLLPLAAGAASNTEFRRWILAAEVADVAGLAQPVCEAAEAGDEVALDLVREAGRALANHVLALLEHFPGGEEVPVALNGGLVVPDSAVRRALLTELATRAPKARVTDVAVDPAYGALRIAMRETA